AFVEHFRLDRSGQLDDTQHRLVSREEMYAYRADRESDGENLGGWFGNYNQNYDYGRYGQAPQWQVPRQQYQPPPWRGFFGGGQWWDDDPRQRPRRVDPDYPWRSRGLY